MKKYIALLMALFLCLALVPAAVAEEDEETDPALSLLGDWYADLQGIPLQLTLNGDGTYILAFPGLPDEPTAGTWVYDDGFLFLDGDEDAPLSVDGDVLSRKPLDLYFTREPAAIYAPGELRTDAPLEAFSGLWRSVYVEVDGLPLSASLLDDDTFVYVEGSRAALGGALFGDAIAAFTFADGILTLPLDGVSIALALQTDGLLRLTLSGADPLTLYLGHDEAPWELEAE